MATNNNIISFGQHQNQVLETSHQKAITSCRLILASLLPKYFDFFSHLDDSLFKLAEQAQSNLQQEEFFAVMRHFRVQQNNVKQQFTNLVLTDYDNFWSQPPVAAHSEKSSLKDVTPELSLMQNDVLEEEIALEKITEKGSHDCRSEIYQLERRFSYMLDTHKEIDNPLSLSKIAAHLKTVISSLTNDIAIKLVAYKHFEQYSIDILATTYQSINDELIQQGILSNIPHGARKQGTSSNRIAPSSNSRQASQSNEEEEYEDSAIFDDLRHLLNNSRQKRTTSTKNTTSSTAQLNTLVSILSNLQHQTEIQPNYNDNGRLVLPDLRQTLQASLNQKQADGSIVHQSMSNIDEDTLNIISFLFEFILEDGAIPSPIRALLARLQLPMLKVAITDKTFFSKKNHTARRLLNNLAKVSTGWDHTNGTDDLLFKQIDSIVTAILTQFETDMQIFDDLNSQLNQFIAQQEKSSEFTEHRITTATEGHEKLALSQQEVDKVINELLVQYSPVPKTVLALIDEGWKKVLRLRYLQKGENSTEWKEAVDIMEKLLWSVQPKSDPDARKELIETIPLLVKSLRTNLSGASFNQYKITKLFKELQECHLKSLNGHSHDQSDLQYIEKEAEITHDDEPNLLDSVAIDKKQLTDEEALQKATELAVGTWLEVTENEQVQRMKFSWRSNLTGRCLFVTYQGMKAAEPTLQELASWFQQGRAVIFDQASIPLMDRALVSMKNIIDQEGKVE